MNETIIQAWNSKVHRDDDVYILGDLFYKTNTQDYHRILKTLKGRKQLIVGNHDSIILNDPELQKYFVEIDNLKTINDSGKMITLCHYPLVEWNGYYKNNSYHLFGHVHNTFNNETTLHAMNRPKAFNVGVDIIGWAPLSINEIIRKYENKKW